MARTRNRHAGLPAVQAAAKENVARATAAAALLPSKAVKPTDGEIYAAWEDMHCALREVMRKFSPDVVRWLAEHVGDNSLVREVAEDHLEALED